MAHRGQLASSFKLDHVCLSLNNKKNKKNEAKKEKPVANAWFYLQNDADVC